MPLWVQIAKQIVPLICSVGGMLWKFNKEIRAMKKEQEKRNREDLEAIKQMVAEMGKNYSDTLGQIQKQLDTALPALERKFENGLSGMRLEFEKRLQEVVREQESKRSESVRLLHARVEKVENKFVSEVMERLGNLEGTMTAKMGSIENTLSLIQRHFIENGGEK